MPHDDLTLQQQMQRALDGELSGEELALLQSRLDEGEQRAANWERMRQTDELLRKTPSVAPARGFADRVMAAIVAMGVPEFARRHTSVGVALGLVAAALLTVPVLWAMLFVIVSVLTDPGALGAVLQTILEAAGAVADLLADLVDQAQAFTGETALIGTVFAGVAAVTIVWLGLLWRLMGGRSAPAAQTLAARPCTRSMPLVFPHFSWRSGADGIAGARGDGVPDQCRLRQLQHGSSSLRASRARHGDQYPAGTIVLEAGAWWMAASRCWAKVARRRCAADVAVADRRLRATKRTSPAIVVCADLGLATRPA